MIYTINDGTTESQASLLNGIESVDLLYFRPVSCGCSLCRSLFAMSAHHFPQFGGAGRYHLSGQCLWWLLWIFFGNICKVFDSFLIQTSNKNKQPNLKTVNGFKQPVDKLKDKYPKSGAQMHSYGVLILTFLFLYKRKRDVNKERSWMLLSATSLAHPWPISGVIASSNALNRSLAIAYRL